MSSSIPIKYDNRVEWRNEKGRIHREDGPAIEWDSGYKTWLIEGLYHREDGPAYEGSDSKGWYINNELHREDGPALEHIDGYKAW